MSTVKTQVKISEVKRFLQKEFGESITLLKPVGGGEYSCAFVFNAKDEKYIIRVNKTAKSYRKDRYAYNNFHSNTIPIPKIIRIGRFNKRLYFTISERAEGKLLDDFTIKELNKLLPQIVNVLDAIHSTKISGKNRKAGDLNTRGIGTFDSWKEYILAKRNRTGMEKEFFGEIEAKIASLIKYCPGEKQYLVHGDYGFNNVLSDGKKITGVIDWGESKYGDFLYDVAWLDFWSHNIKYAKKFKIHYQRVGTKIPNYEERIACYKLFLGLSSFNFFTNSGQKHNASWVKKHTESILLKAKKL